MNSEAPGRTAIVWFRQDLRLRDNPALYHAVRQGYTVLPVFILDDNAAGAWAPGAASRWWLHHSLTAFNRDLSGRLHLYRGDAQEVMSRLTAASNASAIFWNRCYEPWRIAQDETIHSVLSSRNITVESFNAGLLREPWEVLKRDGSPYRVFTPYYQNGFMNQNESFLHQINPGHFELSTPVDNLTVNDLKLLPSIAWDTEMNRLWSPGEQGAQARLQDFLANGLRGYRALRDRPDLPYTSRLSPHLHFGEISPSRLWRAVSEHAIALGLEDDAESFHRELGWREFCHNLLHHNPDMPATPLQEKFETFPWADNPAHLRLWQKGKTGIPIVDAGMRQLWREGWMHNRVRMIAASFLVKNLRIHWHHGQRWFWDCLVDADLANNAASWQWVAGCGADAAPYFRIFNPVAQGEKFDPAGDYVRRYVPELVQMPSNYIHKPWMAPEHIPKGGYPAPLVDLKASRDKALECWRQIK